LWTGLTGQVGQDALNNTGFSEAYADELFTSLVKVDQVLASSAVGDSGIGDGTGKIYDSKGKLIRNQGELFDSTLHFIGFGRGAVVNTEIVQRLGTFYPLAGGAGGGSDYGWRSPGDEC
jgi:hypothetical protein